MNVDSRDGDRANLSAARLVEHALARGEGRLSADGALVFETGAYTGRSPKDKFIVRGPSTADQVDWGSVNQPFEPAAAEALRHRVEAHLAGRETFAVDAHAGADPAHRLPIRVVAERAYHALFARQLFRQPSAAELADHRPEFTVLAAPDFRAVPGRDGTRSEVFIILDFDARVALIGGTLYAGEIKKSIFSVMNTILPRKAVLPMHCSANVGPGGDVALFFGLSGTGKTTLSADPSRGLIGDDEHGWAEAGVFNVEGGCYAKCIGLTRDREPEIHAAIRFGTVLENVEIDPATRVPDYASARLTENTRAAYPLEFIPNHVPSGRAGHPSKIIFLTCDAFGVLPPLSRLGPEAAMYHFLSGYTAKVAGTERDLGVGPEATFSTCFGAPFMTLPPARYASLLGEKLRAHRPEVWLLNTGWTGGPAGVGRRIDLAHTRSMVDAILGSSLADAPIARDPVFNLDALRACPGVPAEVFDPRSSWADPSAFDARAADLASRFRANFARFAGVDPSIAAAGPLASA